MRSFKKLQKPHEQTLPKQKRIEGIQISFNSNSRHLSRKSLYIDKQEDALFYPDDPVDAINLLFTDGLKQM